MTTVPDIPPETFPSSLPRRESAVGLSSARTGVVVHLSADSSIIEVPVRPGTALEMWRWLTRYLQRTDERGPLEEEMGKILNAELRTKGSLDGIPVPYRKDVPIKQVVDYAAVRAKQNPDCMAGPLVGELAYVFLGVPKGVLEPYLPQPVDPDAELIERLARKQAATEEYVWDEQPSAAKERMRARARHYLELVREVEQELKGEDQ